MMKRCKILKEKSGAGSLLPNIPEEVIFFNILNRVPAKSLLRFRCVSKHWCRTIASDPEFISSFMIHAQQNPSVMAFFQLVDKETLRNSYNFISFGPNFDAEGGCSNYFQFQSLRQRRTFFIGYCNGLFCIRNRFGFEIWNLTTREVLSTSFPKIDDDPGQGRTIRSIVVNGFGFDPINHEYKVIYIVHGVKFMVYTLGTNSWRDITPTLSLSPDLSLVLKHLFLSTKRPGLYISNTRPALHWLFNRHPSPPRPSPTLISFDIHLEKFTAASAGHSISDSGRAPYRKPPSLIEWRGCPCIFHQRIARKRHFVRIDLTRLSNFSVRSKPRFLRTITWIQLFDPYLKSDPGARLFSLLGPDLFFNFSSKQRHLTLYNPTNHRQLQIALTTNSSSWFHQANFIHHIENLLSLKTLLLPSKTDAAAAAAATTPVSYFKLQI